MNTNTFAFVSNTVRALALAALVSLSVAQAQTAARADVVIDKFVDPQHTLGVSPGGTALQLKVRNANSYTVSGVTVQTYIYLATDLVGWQVRAMPRSAALTLAPGASTWVTINIPAYSIQGPALYGQHLYAKAILNSNVYWLKDFIDLPAQADLEPTVVHTNTTNGADVFTVTITNNGYAPSTAQKVTVSTWQDADGRNGSVLNQTANIPALQVGQSIRLTFTSQPTNGYQIKGTVQIGSGSKTSFAF